MATESQKSFSKRSTLLVRGTALGRWLVLQATPLRLQLCCQATVIRSQHQSPLPCPGWAPHG